MGSLISRVGAGRVAETGGETHVALETEVRAVRDGIGEQARLMSIAFTTIRGELEQNRVHLARAEQTSVNVAAALGTVRQDIEHGRVRLARTEQNWSNEIAIHGVEAEARLENRVSVRIAQAKFEMIKAIVWMVVGAYVLYRIWLALIHHH